MPPFRYEQPVRFGDVDHAGIVYYPRFFHYFHITFEELFGDGEYKKILDERRIGFPAVRFECDFARPLRYGDVIAVELSTDRIGTSSITFRYVVTRAGDEAPCAVAKVTVVTIDMDTFKPLPLPDDLRAMFAALQ